jgi:hypothetical protein
MAFSRGFFLRDLRILGRIGNSGAAGFGKGRKSVNPTVSCTHDVLGANIANGQGVRDERTMAAPWQRFGTHQCDPALVGQLNQFFEAFRKFRSLHVIRITSERGISPAQVQRITFGMTQPAQSRHVNVPQAGFLQRVWQRILIELWVVSRARYRPHIHHARHAMRLKKTDELLERACRMSNR